MKKYLLTLLICAFFLRIWHGQELFFWHIDEEIIAQTVKRILVDHRPQLLGFPIPGGIYLGPLIYYVISIFFAASFMNPANLPLFSSILGLLTVLLVYKVGENLFNQKVGLIAATLYTFSYVTNVYSRLFTGLTFVPIVSLLTYLSLYKIITTGQKRYLLMLAPTLIFASQNEGSSISLIFLSLIVWMIYKFKIKKKNLVLFLLLFTAVQLPLLLFDARHDHFVFKSFINFFLNDKPPGSASFETYYRALNFLPATISRLIVPTGNTSIADQILPCAHALGPRSVIFTPLILLSFFILAFFPFYLLRRKSFLGAKIILIHLFIIAAGIAIYNLFSQDYLYEWMLVIFFPGFYFIIAFFLDKVKLKDKLKNALIGSFILLFSLINIYFLIETEEKFGLSEKQLAVKYAISQIGNEPFELQSLGSCYQNGYIYLFWQMGRPPVKSYEDERFSSTLQLNPNNIKPVYKVVIINDSGYENSSFQQRVIQEKEKSITSKKLRSIEVIISRLII